MAAAYVCHLCHQASKSGWDFGEGHVCPDCNTENAHLAEMRRHLAWLEVVIADRRAVRRVQALSGAKS